MGLDALLEWIEWVDDIMRRRDVLRILGFWKDGVEVQQSKGVVEFFRSDQIRSVWTSTGRDELRS